MKNICVITGGGSGMGLATARIMVKTHYVIICGRTVEKLENVVLHMEYPNTLIFGMQSKAQDYMETKESVWYPFHRGTFKLLWVNWKRKKQINMPNMLR
jgi:short-subunit dehydrogenase involved in D-alanine esterification of teichoic acids